MRSFRAIKTQARRDLHREAQVPALYISPAPGVEPRLVFVRLHHKPAMIGQLTGSKDYGAKAEIKSSVVVLREQIAKPPNGGIFSFAQGVAFRIHHVEKPDGITVTCQVNALSVAETANLAFPLPDADTRPPTTDPDMGTGVGIGETKRIEVPIYAPQSNWTYAHNLGYYPEVLTLGPNGEEIEGNVQHTSVNVVTINFNPPTSGTLILI